MLIECLECKNQISSRARACPKCGAPVELPAEREPNRTAGQHDVVQANFWETENGGIVLKAVAATISLILFRIFAIEWVYGLITRIILEFKASDLEIALGLAWTTPEVWINSFWLGYAVPWLLFYGMGVMSVLFVLAAIIGAFFASIN